MREKTPNFWILGNVCSDNKSDLLISSELPKKQEVTYFGQKKKKILGNTRFPRIWRRLLEATRLRARMHSASQKSVADRLVFLGRRGSNRCLSRKSRIKQKSLPDWVDFFAWWRLLDSNQ